VVPVIREALAAVAQSRADMTIVLNPQDAENAQSELARILAAHALRLSTDASITRGGARLESPAGNVDATLETRWQRVREAIGMPASQVDDRANDEARR
jgi:flagellar assembly protein FliH